MEHLVIKYRFQNLPFIVADGMGEFYQLAHFKNNYSRPFRKLNRVLNNGITEGYRIERKFVSLNQLRKSAYEFHQVIELSHSQTDDIPF